MLTSILVLILSGVMFFYWLRYTCLLFLQCRHSVDYARPVIDAHELSFREIAPDNLSASVGAQLDRDYQIVNALLAKCNAGDQFQLILLKVDYVIMRRIWSITRSLAPTVAVDAAKEMRGILENWTMLVGLAESSNSAF